MDLPQVLAQLRGLIRLFGRWGDEARRTDPEDPVTPARHRDSHLLRALKPAFEIEDGQNHDIVLAAGRDPAFQAGGRATATGYESVHTLRYEVQDVRKLQLEFFQPGVTAESGIQGPSQEGRDAAPFLARQQRVGFANGEHDSPGALAAILGELLPKPVVEFLKTFGVAALRLRAVRLHLRPHPRRIPKGEFWFVPKPA